MIKRILTIGTLVAAMGCSGDSGAPAVAPANYLTQAQASAIMRKSLSEMQSEGLINIFYDNTNQDYVGVQTATGDVHPDMVFVAFDSIPTNDGVGSVEYQGESDTSADMATLASALSGFDYTASGPTDEAGLTAVMEALRSRLSNARQVKPEGLGAVVDDELCPKFDPLVEDNPSLDYEGPALVDEDIF